LVPQVKIGQFQNAVNAVMERVTVYVKSSGGGIEVLIHLQICTQCMVEFRVVFFVVILKSEECRMAVVAERDLPGVVVIQVVTGVTS